MATTEPTQERSFHLGHFLAIAGIALALILGAFAVDAAASIGVLTRSVGMATPIPDLVPAPVPPVAASPLPAPA